MAGGEQVSSSLVFKVGDVDIAMGSAWETSTGNINTTVMLQPLHRCASCTPSLAVVCHLVALLATPRPLFSLQLVYRRGFPDYSQTPVCSHPSRKPVELYPGGYTNRAGLLVARLLLTFVVVPSFSLAQICQSSFGWEVAKSVHAGGSFRRTSAMHFLIAESGVVPSTVKLRYEVNLEGATVITGRWRTPHSSYISNCTKRADAQSPGSIR